MFEAFVFNFSFKTLNLHHTKNKTLFHHSFWSFCKEHFAVCFLWIWLFLRCLLKCTVNCDVSLSIVHLGLSLFHLLFIFNETFSIELVSSWFVSEKFSFELASSWFVSECVDFAEQKTKHCSINFCCFFGKNVLQFCSFHISLFLMCLSKKVQTKTPISSIFCSKLSPFHHVLIFH